MATKICKHVVYLACAPSVDSAVCSGYMTAAINTEHTIMFVQDSKDSLNNMYMMDVAQAQLEFKQDAAGWKEKHGFMWFFCQCKPDKKDKCSIQ